MESTIIQGTVRNGQIHLDEDVSLPEATKVYVYVPNTEKRTTRVMSPRLVNKADAKRFVKTIEADTDDEIR